MSYHLVALVARPSNGGFADAVARMGGITCVLPQELVVVPLTPTVKKTASTGDDQAVLGFHELTEGIVRVGESLSLICRTAYVHAENDAGPGFQAAVGWEEGSLCWGPVFTQDRRGEAEDYYELAKLGEGAVNRALRFLGVDRGNSLDEFAAVGLGRNRWTWDWPGVEEDW